MNNQYKVGQTVVVNGKELTIEKAIRLNFGEIFYRLSNGVVLPEDSITLYREEGNNE